MWREIFILLKNQATKKELRAKLVQRKIELRGEGSENISFLSDKKKLNEMLKLFNINWK
jgi:hypothetical protein